MMEVSGAAERIGLTFNAAAGFRLMSLWCWLAWFGHHAVCWSGRCAIDSSGFFNAKKTNTSLLKLAIPLCTALMQCTAWFLHIRLLYMLPISWGRYRFGDRLRFAGWADGITDGGPLFLKFLGQRLPFKPVPTSLPISKFAMKKHYRHYAQRFHHTATHCADVG